MAHYATHFSINELRLDAHLGVYDAERAAPQPVSISLRLYYQYMPHCTANDHGTFIDYHALSNVLTHAVTTREFRLIEFMAQELFALARDYINRHGGEEVALWFKLTKLAPAVDYLQKGASFVLCDLPAGATVSPAE